jgi:hypothetical protein
MLRAERIYSQSIVAFPLSFARARRISLYVLGGIIVIIILRAAEKSDSADKLRVDSIPIALICIEIGIPLSAMGLRAAAVSEIQTGSRQMVLFFPRRAYSKGNPFFFWVTFCGLLSEACFAFLESVEANFLTPPTTTA